MRFPVRALALGAACAAVVVSCSVPTDKSQDIQVGLRLSDTLQARGVLGIGDRDSVFAFAFRVNAAGDTLLLPNVAFTWQSDSRSVAEVDQSGDGVEVTGLTAGTAKITARAAAFEGAAPGDVTLRVAAPFVIDSVRPKTVHFGDQVRFYGVGIRNLFAVSLGGPDLIRDFFSFSGSETGLGSEGYWVPFPSNTDLPFYIGPGFFGSAPDSVTVLPFDLYEPDDSQSVPIDINGPGGPRSLFGLPVLFYNPALYYEPLSATPFSEDWYSFNRTDTTQAISLIVSPDFSSDTAFTYVGDTIVYLGGGFISLNQSNYVLSPGTGTFKCGPNYFFTFVGSRPLTTVHAFRTMPSSRLQLFTATRSNGGYSLAALHGYFVADRRIPPDRFEEDDLWCLYADSTFAASNDSTTPARKHIVVGLPSLFGENGPWLDSTLTIDNPGDIDWIKFRVQPPVLVSDTFVTVATKSLPLGAFDPSDIDVFIMRASDFAIMGAAENAGSSEQITVPLAAGDYYLGIADVAGEPTHYSLCLAKSSVACTPPGVARPAQLSPAVRQRLPTPRHDPRTPLTGASLGPVRGLPSPRQ
jgi:hypothetical protein